MPASFSLLSSSRHCLHVVRATSIHTRFTHPHELSTCWIPEDRDLVRGRHFAAPTPRFSAPEPLFRTCNACLAYGRLCTEDEQGDPLEGGGGWRVPRLFPYQSIPLKCWGVALKLRIPAYFFLPPPHIGRIGVEIGGAHSDRPPPQPPIPRGSPWMNSNC